MNPFCSFARISFVFKSELALPAGNLQCALYAFKGGADAVYLGMKLFSARAGAVNFSFEDLRKLKYVCQKENKKFYITLNTLVQDSDLNEVVKLLRQLEYLQPNGVIIQDLGIVNLIRKHFPSLEMHASTQLAVHTVDGVKELQSLGFKRVVLSRELSFDEIAEIRKQCPDVELKVFIHGALCYGFSGLCMASQFITGRSANCGSCAQICRTWFSCRETKQDAWFFSMKDLCLGDKVKQLQEAKIDSLKVEGRMKGPEYVYWCARYYRMLLDGKTEKDNEVIWAKEAMQIAFSRDTTSGFFNTKTNGSTNSEIMVCSDYPSHRGIEVGIVQKTMNSKAIVEFSKPVALRDGLLVTSDNTTQGFALTYIEGSKSFVSEGQTAIINFPTEKFKKRIPYGTKVMCISRHNGNLPLINENIPLYKKPVNISVKIDNGVISAGHVTSEIELQQSKQNQDIKEVLENVFSASDKSFFTLQNLSVENKSSVKNPFLPLSILKQFRRDFYSALDNDFENEQNSKFSFAKETTGNFEIPENAVRLLPVTFNEKQYFEQLSENIPEVAGLNNIAQVKWAKEHPEVKVFADAFLYAKNSEAIELLKEELPNYIGSISENDTKLPIFISRVCFRHHGLGLDCKGCSKNNTYHIQQNNKSYKVECKNCMTTVTEE